MRFHESSQAVFEFRLGPMAVRILGEAQIDLVGKMVGDRIAFLIDIPRRRHEPRVEVAQPSFAAEIPGQSLADVVVDRGL